MTVLQILLFILGLSILVLLHEFGHFIMAKIFGVYVYEFSLFMGPKIFQFQKGETKYTLRALPLGGYCSLAGDEDSQSKRNEEELEKVSEKPEENKTDDRPQVPVERTLQGISNWKKILIMGAGAFNNIILSWVFLFFVGLCHPELNLGFVGALQYAFVKQWELASLIFVALGKLITGTGWNEVGGIIAMTDQAVTFMNAGFWNFMFYLGFISVNLGIMNLLPFPALDGGRILLTIIESITRKKVSKKAENIINTIGFVLLMILMAAVTIKDIIGLFKK